ncbi:hypothetical protein J3D45_000905 [Microbacterium foliorum]|nr:hypothetical protein [Microbacterium foliorum]
MVKMHAQGIDRLRLPQRRTAFPRGKAIRACDWALSSGSVPNGPLERAAIGDPLMIFGFVPQMGDKTVPEGLVWNLTHPPVVFGPHRSPRGEGHTIFRAAPRARRMTFHYRSCNIWVTG